MNKEDKRYLRLLPILEHPANTKIIIWGRDSGKSYSTKYWILGQIEQENKEFIWLRRQFDSIRTGSLESWKRVIANYCADNKVPEKDMELVWDAITRGVKYNGTMKCFMVELFSSYKSRENYTQGISQIIFDEAIVKPTTGEQYLANEEDKVKELLGSAWRGRENNPPSPQPKLTYIANPYDRFRPFMANFLPIIRKNLTKLKQRIFANEIINLEIEQDQGSHQGELLSLYKPTTCLKENECSCIDENCVQMWNNFFAKEEDLKMCEFINGSRPLYVFAGCIKYLAKTGYKFFINQDSKEISNKEDIPYIKEYCLSQEQRRKSQQKIKWDYQKEILRTELLDEYEHNKLFFVDSKSKEIIEKFIDKGLL